MGGASDIASKVDSVFIYIFALTGAFLVFITALMIFFVFKYSRKKGVKPVDIEGHMGLEVLWTVIPLILFLSMFYYGWTNFKTMRAAPGDALVVKVLGRQWAWDFTYPNGKKSPELYAALNRPMKLDLESQDVIHGFWIPAFRVKQDVVPGKRNYTWFTPQRLGVYDIECTVICGVSHTYMLSKVHVIPEDEFKRWYFETGDAVPPSVAVEQARLGSEARAGGAGGGSPAAGRNTFLRRGCATCHTSDGSTLVGPSMKGLYGSPLVVVDGGGIERTVLADEAHLAKAISDPGAELVKGYRPTMPKVMLTHEEIADILAYVRSLK